MALSPTTSRGAAGATGGATVATTVAGLGAGSAGALGMIRVGSSPYDYMALIYDATLAAWVSPATPIEWQTSADYNTTMGATYAEITAGINSPRRYYVPNGALFYAAGLRPYINISAFANVATGAMNFRGAVDWITAAGAATAEALVSATALSITGGAAQLVSGWVAMTGAAPTTETHAAVYIEWQNASITGMTLRALQALLRWVG